MIVVRTVHAGIDISSSFTLLTYTHVGDKPISVLPRVELGDSTKPIVGGGNVYDVITRVNGSIITPLSKLKVPTGQTEAVLMGRDVVLEVDDVVQINVIGAAGDDDVNVIISLFDATPAQIEDFIGTGAVLVDHNYGGTNTLQAVDGLGAGIDNTSIRGFLTADWSAGNRGANYVRATTTTVADGTWRHPMMLDPGTYTLLYYKQGSFQPKTVSVVVTAE